MKKAIGVLVVALTGIMAMAPAAKAVWSLNGTTGAENWLLGATAASGSGTLEVCNLTTHAIITWPTGTAPANNLSADGSINMNAGNDYLRIINNDGTYDSGCGMMYRVLYNGHEITIKGGTGDDHLIGGLGVDNIFGDDTSDAETCQDAVTGGNDVLSSGGGADVIYGCGGNDIFDTFYSGGGFAPTVYGGYGADCIEFAANETAFTYDDPCDPSGTNEDGDVDSYDSTTSLMNDNTCMATGTKIYYSPTDADTGTASLSCI